MFKHRWRRGRRQLRGDGWKCKRPRDRNQRQDERKIKYIRNKLHFSLRRGRGQSPLNSSWGRRKRICRRWKKGQSKGKLQESGHQETIFLISGMPCIKLCWRGCHQQLIWEQRGWRQKLKDQGGWFWFKTASLSLFKRSRGELTAKVVEKQAGMELERKEWKEKMVKSKQKALEVRFRK